MLVSLSCPPHSWATRSGGQPTTGYRAGYRASIGQQRAKAHGSAQYAEEEGLGVEEGPEARGAGRAAKLPVQPSTPVFGALHQGQGGEPQALSAEGLCQDCV